MRMESQKQNQTRENSLPTLLGMRVLVGYLGEQAQFGWWQTGFYDPNSARALKFAFPNTAVARLL